MKKENKKANPKTTALGVRKNNTIIPATSIKENKSAIKTNIGVANKSTTKELSFLRFAISKKNKIYLFATILIAILYFIFLRIYFPFPSFFSDSNAYVQCASNHQLVSFRPTGYSRFISFFHDFSDSDFALIIGQYGCNVIANLLFFLSLTYFFSINKILKNILFIVLLANPLYLLYSNYVLSDSFFCSFTIAWFTVLIWMVYKPGWFVFIAQLVMLVLLFKLRYNAITYPFITALAVVFSRQEKWKKWAIVITSAMVIYLVQLNISTKTEEITGTYVFSAFGGWQLASNALYVVRKENINPTIFTDDDSKAIYKLSKNYFDSIAKIKHGNDTIPINGTFLWDQTSPLKTYLVQYAYAGRLPNYFRTWTALGPIYSDFGMTVIKNNPLAYIKYFVLPNAASYWKPEMEAYDNYNTGSDTVSKTVKDYFKYSSNKVNAKSADGIYKILMHPYKWIFPVINAIFILLAIATLINKRIRKQQPIFFKSAILMCGFYVINFCFVVGLAPTVFRYHVSILTLCVAFSIYFIQYLFIAKKTLIKV